MILLDRHAVELAVGGLLYNNLIWFVGKYELHQVNSASSIDGFVAVEEEVASVLRPSLFAVHVVSIFPCRKGS
jgi:hypothetical protein